MNEKTEKASANPRDYDKYCKSPEDRDWLEKKLDLIRSYDDLMGNLSYFEGAINYHSDGRFKPDLNARNLSELLDRWAATNSEIDNLIAKIRLLRDKLISQKR